MSKAGNRFSWELMTEYEFKLVWRALPRLVRCSKSTPCTPSHICTGLTLVYIDHTLFIGVKDINAYNDGIQKKGRLGTWVRSGQWSFTPDPTIQLSCVTVIINITITDIIIRVMIIAIIIIKIFTIIVITIIVIKASPKHQSSTSHKCNFSTTNVQ